MKALFKSHFLLSLGLFLLLAASCTTSKLITKKEQKHLSNQISESAIFAKGFTGFQLYDPLSRTILLEQLADKYFTPASNTKIFTYFTADQLLGDSIPALKYIIRNDSLIFWGTGDPTLLHPHLSNNQIVIDFLNRQKEQLFYCPDNFMDTRYGSGWMWDDYPYYFQVELSALPIYGNFIRVQGEKRTKKYSINPSYFAKKLQRVPSLGESTARFYRQEKNNIIEYNEQPVGKKDLDRELPFIYDDTLLLKLLQDSLGRPVRLLNEWGIPPEESQTIFSVPTDSVLQRMMVVSDNFLAEQLILLCSSTIFDTLNVRKGIEMAKDSLFNDTPDELFWHDGSGLTRYNQFTPRSMVYVLEKIYREIEPERWQAVFSVGDLSETIKNSFGDKNKPYIYAKTGSMRNVRCLSGYVLTQSGKTLIFSFMNNHIPGSSRQWTIEMEKVLRWVHENL